MLRRGLRRREENMSKKFAFQSVKVLCLQARWMRHYIHNAAHFDPYKGFVRKRGVRRHRLRRGRP